MDGSGSPLIMSEKVITINSPAIMLASAPMSKKVITILSIDGGGVRGIIPGTILAFLEKALQEADNNPEARLADYFDVIAGTSIGGLVTAMLTAPNEHGRPLLAAKDINNFYFDNCSKIFPHRSGILAPLWNAFTLLTGPRYDGKFLHHLINRTFPNNARLSQSLTNVAIPTYDVKTLQPVIFASNEVSSSPSLDCKLSDICTGTSALPTYLPAYGFKNESTHGIGNKREFNLIGGSVCASNPTLVAMSTAAKEIFKQNPEFLPVKPTDYERFIVISLGTGSISPKEEKYDAKLAAEWGIFGWFLNSFSNLFSNDYSTTPIVDLFTQASVDMVDLHLSTVFQSLNAGENYLRIQDNTLTGKSALIDNSTKENLLHLVNVGKALLKEPVMRVDIETGEPTADEEGTTNEAALRSLASRIAYERRRRNN